MRLFDSHAHLNLPELAGERDAVLARARAAGVHRIVNVGVDAATSRLAREIAGEDPGLHATAALHPNYVSEQGAEGLAEVEALLREGGFVAVGETGLDYYRDHSKPEAQRKAFRRHLSLAAELSLPVVVHCREAHEDCRRILAEEIPAQGLSGRVIMHCFGGSPEDARHYVELSTYVSFSGVVTFPNAGDNRKAATMVPDDRLLAETDCPYLAPQARRGQRNEPAFVGYVVEELAKVRKRSPEEMAEITYRNACRVFDLPEEDA